MTAQTKQATPLSKAAARDFLKIYRDAKRRVRTAGDPQVVANSQETLALLKLRLDRDGLTIADLMLAARVQP